MIATSGSNPEATGGSPSDIDEKTHRNSALPDSDRLPLPPSSRASTVPTDRQLQLQAQEKELLNRIADSTRTVAELSTSASGDGTTRAGNPMQTLLGDALRDIERLKEEMAWLREQRESDWARGSTDVLPPPYHSERSSDVVG